jgi:two-component system LytT family response regulator
MNNTMYSTLLVDDEPAANKLMSKLLSAHPEFKIIDAVESVSEARKVLRSITPDVIFLDVEMPKKSGLQLLGHLKPETTVVFVTAYENYAVQAFEAGALDYLVKPVSPERLEIAISRIKRLRSSESSALKENPPEEALLVSPTMDSIHLPSRRYGKSEMLKLADIVWVEGAQNYTHVQLLSAKSTEIYRRRLMEWEGLLTSKLFKKLDRSLIVQVSLISSTEWINRDETVISFHKTEAKLSIGRAASQKLKEIFQEFGM